MSKIIVDIETIGVDFDSLEKKQQEYLLKYSESDDESQKIIDMLGLYPLTGEIVAIGMLNPETGKGVMLYQAGGEKPEDFEEEGVIYEAGDEEALLEKFWDFVKTYNQVITFNGRGFDVPYLMMRSAVHRIRPSKNLLGYRFDSKVHCDLLDQLTFYGAARKYNMDFYAKAFGLKSSKDEGVDGSMVGDLYKKGEYLQIARYCVRDLVTTKELFDIWNKYLSI